MTLTNTFKNLAMAASLILATPVSAEMAIFRCTFDWVCDPNRKCDYANLDVRFKVDLVTEKVERIGKKNDLVELEMIFGDRAITILEKPISGGLTSTTLMINDGTAVRSENEIKGHDLAPMQYLGECISM